jgi:60 kDa SS-A/Ro ribonucleoprotein
VRCIDVAALVAAAVLRKDRAARVLPFEQEGRSKLSLNARDSAMSNAQQAQAAISGGGTNCSAPLAFCGERRCFIDPGHRFPA